MSAPAEDGRIADVPIITVRNTVPVADVRIRDNQLSAQEKAAILLRARFKPGDVVKHSHFSWSGIVRKIWVQEIDGTIWVSVQRFRMGPRDDFYSFSARETVLEPGTQPKGTRSLRPYTKVGHPRPEFT